MTASVSLRADACSWVPTDTGRVVVLDLRQSTYFQLNNAAAILWDHLAGGATRQSLRDLLVDRFGISTSTAEQDVGAFLDSLAARDLLTE